MAKKAISNNYCEGKFYEAGKVYSDAEVKGLDPKDFEDLGTDEVIEEAEIVVDDELPKVVDQQMLDENPDLKEAGVTVGSPISLATDEEVDEALNNL